MSGTVDIKRVLLAVMAMAALVVVLAVPLKAQAASDCAAAGTDPTAAQYCPPTEPEEECTENGSGNNQSGSGGNNSGSGSENCQEASVSPPPAPPSASASEGGTLPFTGTDVVALMAIAAAFIAVGLALQRLSKARVEQG